MSKSLHTTVYVKARQGGWVARKMCGEHELFRLTATTRDKAREKIRTKYLQLLSKLATSRRLKNKS
jgi:hypothetical protein